MTRRGRDLQPSPSIAEALTPLCELACWAHGAAAVSVAVVTDDGLEYVAASGAGAAEIVGTRLGGGEGLAGFVAATGQSITVRDVVRDPRFARHVAERTGYVPDSIQISPILDPAGEVTGVLSMLDRGRHRDVPDEPPMPLSAFAELAGALLTSRATRSDAADHLLDRIERLDSTDRAAVMAAVAAVVDAVERR